MGTVATFLGRAESFSHALRICVWIAWLQFYMALCILAGYKPMCDLVASPPFLVFPMLFAWAVWFGVGGLYFSSEVSFLDGT